MTVHPYNRTLTTIQNLWDAAVLRGTFIAIHITEYYTPVKKKEKALGSLIGKDPQDQ